MAKNILPTNYVDDIMNSSMNQKRRYKMIQNDDGTVSFEDVTTYDQVGSEFGAANINATNEAVNESFDKNKVIESYADIMANTVEGYVPGATGVKAGFEAINSNFCYKKGDTIQLTALMYMTGHTTSVVNVSRFRFNTSKPIKATKAEIAFDTFGITYGYETGEAYNTMALEKPEVTVFTLDENGISFSVKGESTQAAFKTNLGVIGGGVGTITFTE